LHNINHNKIKALICGLLLALTVITLNSCAQAKTIYGWIEPVIIRQGPLSLKAKLDTGAKGASLNAINILIKKRKGREWVTFDVPLADGGQVTLTRPLVGYVYIKRRQTSENKRAPAALRRPEVTLDLCLGGQQQQIKVNLADRRRFNYPLLLGRTTINKFAGLVDPGQRLLTRAQCPASAKKT
jgi:hypothetical protein